MKEGDYIVRQWDDLKKLSKTASHIIDPELLGCLKFLDSAPVCRGFLFSMKAYHLPGPWWVVAYLRRN